MLLKEDKVPVTGGRKRVSVREETNAVSGMRVTIVHQNQNTLPPHLLSHQRHEVEVCRGKEVSEAKVTLVSFFDNRVDIISKVLARDRLVSIGILSTVNSMKLNRDASSAQSAHSRRGRFKNNQTKSRKRVMTKSAVAIVMKSVRQVSCVS